MAIIITPGHVPLRVTAHLRTGVVMDRPYGLDLSGILASRMRQIQKAELAEVGANSVLPDSGGEDPEDFPLPLSRCTSEDDWYWAATCGVPDTEPEDAPEARVFFQGVDVEHAKSYAVRPLPEVFARKGSYRDVMMPVAVTLASTLTWFAVGDRQQVLRLLEPVRAVGRRRATGEGVVLHWTVEEIDGDPLTIAHMGDTGRLLRPVPIAAAEQLGIEYRVGWYALRPPSWNPNRLMELAMADD